MMRQIVLLERTVAYTLRVSRRSRRMRLAIYEDGRFVVTIPYRMREHHVVPFMTEKARWIINTLDHVAQTPVARMRRHTQEEYLEHKDAALAFARARVEHFNAIYKFAFGNITIRNQKTRWGSCSRKGNLNFNYKICLLPEHLADYIIVHELCHLVVFNHSPSFWNLVSRAIPDHRERRKELRGVLS